MKEKIVIVAFLCVVVFAGVQPVQAATSTEALARMDAIIKEMQTLRAEFAALMSGTQPTTQTAQVLGVTTTAVITEEVVYGATNDTIAKIQRLLATDSEIYADGTVSGYFGPKTMEAIRQFQIRFGLDPVGVVGPATKAILEAFLSAYPTENYPGGLLKGAVPANTVTATPTTSQTTTVTTSVVTTLKIASIALDEDDGEVLVMSRNTDGTRNKDVVIYPDDEDEMVEMIADKLGITESQVRSLTDLDEVSFGSDEEDDAADAITDAKKALSNAKDDIEEAEDDGDDVDDAWDLYDEAKDAYNDARDAFDDEDYEDAIDYAEEAEDLADEAVDEL